ncbi:hypothetical protein EXN66_Car000850 [Channa argus]|uniref:Uncharacterized protein n=1 Tax=Channa argus TaxID=215402 RepID=A0A6G1QYW9_CHAAH|nr:hypothetical protein EXN66_Car000850 [Channa argus]
MYNFVHVLFCNCTQAEREQRRREQYMKSLESFRTNAVEITSKMRDWCEDNPERKPLVDEILHSIFFLGKIINCRFAPNDIFNVDEVRENLEKNYPRPFQCYWTQLPKRGPFSCVLDMVVQLKGQANEEEIKQSLRELYSSLKGKEPKRLSSSTICVSQKSKTSERHYGVSVSNSVPNPRKILIPASCLSTWHEYVAGAVMTYYPEVERKSYFDGTITLPPHVRCQAFSVSNGEEKRPCRSCGNLFGLNTDENMVWPYGNCAEAESLSNLLKREEDVRMEARPNSPLYTEGNRNIARQSVYDELRNVLKEVKFEWDGNFYNPVTTV